MRKRAETTDPLAFLDNFSDYSGWEDQKQPYTSPRAPYHLNTAPEQPTSGRP